MKLERKFYTEEAALWKKAEQKAEKEMTSFSESEMNEDERDPSLKAQETLERTLSDRRHNFHVVQREKFDLFESICNSAMEFAETLPLDIVAEAGQSFGSVTFSADRMMIMSSTPPEMKEILIMLIREADSMDFAVRDDGLLELNFVFSFTSGTRRGKHD